MNPYLSDRGLYTPLLEREARVLYDQLDKKGAFDDPDFWYAVAKTGRAFTLGASLAAADGPLPFGDMVGITVATVGAALAWFEYLTK